MRRPPSPRRAAERGRGVDLLALIGEHRAGTLWPGVVLAEGQVIGQVTVSGMLRQPFLRRGTLGYWIASTAQNRGHAGCAVGLVLRVARETFALHRAEASANLENAVSQRVLRRNGFSPYGVAHSAVFLDGCWQDSLLWERTLGD